ncbi:hypothetical protein AB4455_17410 [Vibrio sp. 10N.261.46.E12]|uniref:hypothetical protein n=1 Tax=unclassified Vibrio TaxID=2614977 RepID=UPI000976246F|nr:MULTISPECIES: hypothetical protein [unclassified Vibrio]OMO36768.1 hypothetical protein BH584_24990 [Vibrio sp. 10N.261.45.E1]PMJ25747.1 hypothetical protein BCU27_10270 [Vibrio sp. 10N.286.45.B6]PML84686.1 hypothetical protein BCT66_16895 [Vibrio sp. 10N.261.49.E11]PMM76244.1 hypothetical protein BCT48_25205 [Vibrio sp. 10N.261.46.F12]PMM83435.1 hypothetical protein BCT46_12730 [Vibrio sp. 10N.261.46.E8]
MPEYLCENCTVAYCFDDCNSPLAQRDMIEVEEALSCEKLSQDPERLEQENSDIKNPYERSR